MNVTIIGTGNMAKGIAARLLSGGNSVTMQSRDPAKSSAIAKELASASKKGATVKVAAMGEAIADPVVVSTVPYSAAIETVKKLGKNLEGKILVDISNPLSPTYDSLVSPPGGSAAEEIAKAAPKSTKVVKGFNTVFAGLLAQGHVAKQPIDIFIAGDDEAAKATVAKLIEEGGQRAFDVGPLSYSRHLESMAFLSIKLQGKVKNPWMSAFQVVS